MQVNEKISIKLVLARQRKKMRASEVAEIIGVTKSYISAIENGRGSISLERLKQISDLYEMDLNYFISETDPYADIVADDFGKYSDGLPTNEDLEKFTKLLIKIVGPGRAQKISYYIMKLLAETGGG